MTNFKKFEGNFKVVSDGIFPEGHGLHGQPYSPITEKGYRAVINDDLPRIAYLAVHKDCDTAPAIRERLSSCELFEEGKSAYMQGSFQGTIFSQMPLNDSTNPEDGSARKAFAEKEKTLSTLRDGIAIAYINDDGQNCAFSLNFRREDPFRDGEQPVPLENRPYSMVVSLIRNTNALPEQRECLVFADEKILSKESKLLSSPVDGIVTSIKEFTHSDQLNKLLSGLILDNGTFSMEKFKELKARLRGGENLDDRDTRKTLLEELIKQKPENSSDKLTTYLDGINKAAAENIDFFKQENFEKTLDVLFSNIKDEIRSNVSTEEARDIAINKARLTY